MNNMMNSDRYLILLEEIKAKVELVAEGHLQLVEGQAQLVSRQERLESRVEAMEIRLSQQIGGITKRVDRLEHSLAQWLH